MELIGPVVRLQVQRSRLKPGPAGNRVYDPAPLREVDVLDIEPRGVRGDGILDVHHASHPETRNRSRRNGLSVMTASRYLALRERYGPHLVDGVAGESVLVDTASADDLSGAVCLSTEDGELELSSQPAPPCVEFSRFVLGVPPGTMTREVRATLQRLSGGARGYYLQTQGSGRVRAGARLFRR